MVTNGDHQTWVPYEPTKDCSLGSCSFYCPQWCSINFPPPPPDDSSGRTFSPLVIAVIGVLAGAFLLVSYYTIFYKYCGTFNSRRERQRQRRHGPGSGDHGLDSYNFDQAHLHETWHFPPSNGLDEALIDEITVCKYKGGDGLIEATECAVCLSEFREDESLRLLPKCSHAFHVQCIDTWLKSHSNCPLCRANVVSVDSTPSWPPPQLPAPPPPPPPEADNNALVEEREHDEEMVSTMESPVTEGDEEAELASVNDHLSKNPLQVHCSSGVMEENSTVVEIRENDDVHPIRRSFSMDCSSCARVPTIAEALQMSLVDEVSAGASSSRRCGGEQSKGNSKCRGGLHCVMSPLPMNRSFSSSRLCLTRHVKGRNAILPV